jgi:hypothetical protein
MTPRPTSIVTYHQIIEEGLVSHRQSEVLKAIHDSGPATDSMLTTILGFRDPNMVRPRRKELLDMGIIEKAKIDLDPMTARTVLWWRVKTVITLNQDRASSHPSKCCPYCHGVGRIHLGQHTLGRPNT